MNTRTATIIGGIGQSLIALGLCVLLFAGFQLYGTGLQTKASQDDLATEFAAQVAEVERIAASTTTQTPTTTSTAVETSADEASETTTSDDATIEAAVDESQPPLVADALAEALLPKTEEIAGRIEIDSIGVDWYYVEGVTRDALRKGPGHYPDTPYPGQAGNAAIAGHRTTYGSPFASIDRIEPGDSIKITTAQGEFYYEVLPYDDGEGNEVGHLIVSPTDVEVVEDQGDNRITLTACHPKFSARQRIIVSAKLVSAPGDPLPTTTTLVPLGADELATEDEATGTSTSEPANTVAASNDFEESLGWHYEEAKPAAIWAGLALLVAIAGAILGYRWKKWPAYALTLLPFTPLLYLCFVRLDRLLPAF